MSFMFGVPLVSVWLILSVVGSLCIWGEWAEVSRKDGITAGRMLRRVGLLWLFPIWGPCAVVVGLVYAFSWLLTDGWRVQVKAMREYAEERDRP